MGSWSERTTSHIGTEIPPDSYGRQQWGILDNGGNPDPATPRGDEGSRVVNPFSGGRIRLGGNAHPMTVLQE